jgi:death-on-curing protein
MTIFLTAQQILFIHARLIDATGGEHGIRDLGLLESAVARPQATFDGKELYPDLFQKAAALMESLAQNHPFVDGNKPTAITACALFMQQNGRRLQTTNKALEAFTLQVVNARPSIDEITSWFRSYADPKS